MKIKIILPALAVLTTVLAACTLIKNKEAISAERGRYYYQEASLGQPLKVSIPYSLWLAMMKRYPQLLGSTWRELSSKYGLIQENIGQGSLPVGFSIKLNRLTNTQFIMTNCSLCHTAKINGKIISGLGARNLRINSLNNALMKIAGDKTFKAKTMVLAAKQSAKKNKLQWSVRTALTVKLAIKKLKVISRNSFKLDAGPGRNTPIEFAKLRTKVTVTAPYGYVRFPPVWTYRRRQSFGWDGSMSGNLALAAASVEFNKGMTSAFILKHQGRWNSIAMYLATIKAPVYPGKINRSLSRHGKTLYQQHCLSCHGFTGKESSTAFKEKNIPLKEIGTDAARLHAMSAQFSRARNKTGFGQQVPLRPQKGYIAVPLDGIWSRAPYLHNGSIPTLRDLLRPQNKRPTYFYIGTGTAYDLKNIGIYYKPTKINRTQRAGKRLKPSQYKFDTTRTGNSNKGHRYGVTLSVKDVNALLEYLKTL